MPSWGELRRDFDAEVDDQAKLKWLERQLVEALGKVAEQRAHRNVIFYGSAFLQKPGIPQFNCMLTLEDLNGLMAVMAGMDWSKQLTIVLHTPGGDPGAANALMAYLHAKFSFVEVIVPTFAMSAGTMMCLGANRIVMGHQSQLGPIDAQMITRNGPVSAGGALDTFERAKSEILANTNLAHLWHPILQTMGPSLLQDAQNALDYGEAMVKGWLQTRMFHGCPDAQAKAESAAKHFNTTSVHKNHSRRIDRNEARSVGLDVEDLEPNQQLQDAVLTSYHVASLWFLATRTVKLVADSRGSVWQKNQS